MKTQTCSCAWCMGIEPWRSNFATCIQKGWTRAWDAVSAGEATEIMRLVNPDGSFRAWTRG